MYSRTKFVNQMISYVGAVQGDKKHKHIVDTYNTANPLPRGYKLKYTDAWCAATVSAAALETGYAINTGMNGIIPLECSCTRMIEKLKALKCWDGNDNLVPPLGSICFFNWDAKTESQDVDGLAHHVGVVIYSDGQTIKTVEGNKDGKCAIRTFPVGWKYIHSYGVLPFDEDEIKPETEEVTYIVQKRDNLTKIAKKFNTTVDRICEVNNIKNKNLIYVGQKLIIK